MDEVGGAVQRVDDPHVFCIRVAVRFAGLFGQDAVVRVGSEQCFDDDFFAGLVNLGDKVVFHFFRHAHRFHIQGCAVDDGPCRARRLDGDVEHGVYGR